MHIAGTPRAGEAVILSPTASGGCTVMRGAHGGRSLAREASDQHVPSPQSAVGDGCKGAPAHDGLQALLRPTTLARGAARATTDAKKAKEKLEATCTGQATAAQPPWAIPAALVWDTHSHTCTKPPVSSTPCPRQQPNPAADPSAGGDSKTKPPALVRGQGSAAPLSRGTAAGGSSSTSSEVSSVPGKEPEPQPWFWRSAIPMGPLTPFSVQQRTESDGHARCIAAEAAGVR